VPTRVFDPFSPLIPTLAVLASLTLGGCRSDGPAQNQDQNQANPDRAEPALDPLLGAPSDPDDPVQRVTIEDPDTHWAHAGFVAMTPPVRLPSTSTERDDVVVWLKIPDGGVIETRAEAGRPPHLLFPPGTISDRVEQRGKPGSRSVIDVRGTEILEHGAQRMHTLRRRGRGDDRVLFGYEWPRAQPEAHAEATRRLLSELAQRPPGLNMSEDRRDRYLASIERKNACTKCHGYDRLDNASEGEFGIVDRGTDSSGFFTPQTVLFDTLPLERYGDVDPNLDDPLIEISCPDGAPVELVDGTKGGRARATCSKGAVPHATLALAEALSQGDPRALSMCRARLYLYSHLDEAGRTAFAEAVKDCSNSR